MNIFNRIVVVLLLVFFIAVSLIAIVNLFTDSFQWSDISLKILNPQNNTQRYVSALVLLVIIAICVALILLEFYRKRKKMVMINNVQSGKAMITIDTIAQQIKESVIRISGIRNLKTDIVPKSGGVIINMLLEVTQDLNIPEKMTEVINAAKQVCREKLNIKVIDTRLTLTSLMSEGPSAKYAGQETQKPGNVAKEEPVQADKMPSEGQAEAKQEDTGNLKEPSGQVQAEKPDKDSKGEQIEVTESALHREK